MTLCRALSTSVSACGILLCSGASTENEGGGNSLATRKAFSFSVSAAMRRESSRMRDSAIVTGLCGGCCLDVSSVDMSGSSKVEQEAQISRSAWARSKNKYSAHEMIDTIMSFVDSVPSVPTLDRT